MSAADDRPRVDGGIAPDPNDRPPGEGTLVEAGIPRGDLVQELSRGRAGQTLLAAFAVWFLTVAPMLFARGAPLLAKGAAVVALVAALAGPVMHAQKRRAGPHVGITLFLAASCVAWLASSAVLHPARLDSIRGATGAIAWGVFALSWSERWTKPEAAHADAEAPALAARTTLPPFAVPIATVGALAALGFLVLAWRTHEPDRALVTQVVAVAASIWFLGAASTVAVARGRKRALPGRRVTSSAVRRLVLLAAAAVLGALYIALR